MNNFLSSALGTPMTKMAASMICGDRNKMEQMRERS
jgi:hypothetical protein